LPVRWLKNTFGRVAARAMVLRIESITEAARHWRRPNGGENAAASNFRWPVQFGDSVISPANASCLCR
jgi:hypothetical protein